MDIQYKHFRFYSNLLPRIQRTPAGHQALLLRPFLRLQGTAAALHRLGRPVRFPLVRRPTQRRAASARAPSQQQQTARRSQSVPIAICAGCRPVGEQQTALARQLGGQHVTADFWAAAGTATQPNETPFDGGHTSAATARRDEQLVVGEHRAATDANGSFDCW